MAKYSLLPWIAWASISVGSTAFAGTLAYYRFEGEPEGTPIKAVKDTEDKSPANGFGNVVYSSRVPIPLIPQTGEANAGSASFPAEGRKGDVFSDPKSAINNHAFTDFTIEAWIYFDTIEGAYQTIIGRDNHTAPDLNLGELALFYLSRIPDTAKGSEAPGTFRLLILNTDGSKIFANSQTTPEAGTWYHISVVGNTKQGTVTMYVNGTEEGWATGYSGLYVPVGGSSWTIGRGQYRRKPADFVTGVIDEVRFSDVALAPAQFLYAPKKP